MRLFREAEEGEQAYGMVVCKVSDAELAELIESMGYVKRPVCKHQGTKHGEVNGCRYVAACFDGTLYCNKCGFSRPNECPSCGGTGFGRLVALDGIDVEALRRWMAPLDGRYWDELSVTEQRLRDVGYTLLAALEGETDGQ